MQKYTKAILALAGMLLPFLETVGVNLPEFLTLDWLQGVIMAATPVLVFWFPNKNTDGTPATVRSPAPIGILAGILAVLMLAGCAGTQSAYKAADGLEETAFVMNAHYLALVREGNRLKNNGTLSGSSLSKAQSLVTSSRPLLSELSRAARAYEAVRSASNEAELSGAIAAAAVVLSDLVNAIREAGGSASLDIKPGTPIDFSLAAISA